MSDFLLQFRHKWTAESSQSKAVRQVCCDGVMCLFSRSCLELCVSLYTKNEGRFAKTRDHQCVAPCRKFCSTGRFKCCAWCVPLHDKAFWGLNFLWVYSVNTKLAIFLWLMRRNQYNLPRVVSPWVLCQWLLVAFGIEKNLTWAMFSSTIHLFVR